MPRPTSLNEALKLLAQPQATWRVLAGGTDILVQYEHHLKELALLDLGAIRELCLIQEFDNYIHIGALTSYSDLARSSVIRTWAPALVMAAREVGGWQIQNMGTLGGNLVNASPAADGVPPLFTLEAKVVLQSNRGERIVPVETFATDQAKQSLAPMSF